MSLNIYTEREVQQEWFSYLLCRTKYSGITWYNSKNILNLFSEASNIHELLVTKGDHSDLQVSWS